MHPSLRKIIALLAATLMITAPLAACGTGGEKPGADDAKKGDKKDGGKKGGGEKADKGPKKPVDVPKKIEGKDLKASLVMPSPDQFLSVLAILGDPKWDDLVEPIEETKYDSDTQTAIVAGIVVAHFFVHVHAKDEKKSLAALDHVLKMTDALGIENPEEEVKKVKTRIKKGKWVELRQDFLDMNQKLQSDLIDRQNKPDLALLISLGAYLEGANLGARIISDDYSKGRAELLRQGDLLKEVKKATDATLDGDDKHVKLMTGSLSDMQKLMDIDGDESIKKDKAEEIRDLAAKTKKKLLKT